jgi:hypothetical protein
VSAGVREPLGLSVAVLVVLAWASPVRGHDGPPFPIVSHQTVGAYEISVWTDPDTTDDGTPGGQFWVTLRTAQDGAAASSDTQATVSIRPLDREGTPRTGVAEPVPGQPAQRFVALLMDHEGRFAVRVVVDGPLGPASVEAEVAGTYDLRPPATLLVVYLVPFLLVGFLWLKLMRRRRRTTGVRQTTGVRS